jgi:DNA-binding CsgD family transcriptional regulator
MSTDDIRIGVRWSHELANALQRIEFGIVCLTEENRKSPWILFEAGALSKTLERGRVIPYLIDIPSNLFDGPLSQYQAINADLDGTRHLVEAIAEANPVNRLHPQTLAIVFERWWPDLESELHNINEKYPVPKVRRPDIRVFTTRDISIIELLKAGKTQKQIAEAIGISRQTLHVQVKQVILKLNASSVEEAIDLAKEFDLIEGEI